MMNFVPWSVFYLRNKYQPSFRVRIEKLFYGEKMVKGIRIIGFYPPPYGGISVHIERLYKELKKAGFNVDVLDLDRNIKDNREIINIRSLKNLIRIFITEKEIVHFHHSGIQLFFLPLEIYYRLIGKKLILTYHSMRGRIDNHARLYRLYHRLFHGIIVVNKDIFQKLKNIGIDIGKVAMIPGFIPPSEEPSHRQVLSQSIENFLNSHSPIISGNAYKLVFINGIDLYGFDLFIDLCYRLKKKFKKVGVILALPQIGETEYFQRLLDEIEKRNLKDNLMIVTEKIELFPIIKRSNVFVRPTITDGDSISVREALHFNIPVVASDVVSRPESVKTFKSRDIHDLYSKILEVLDGPKMNYHDSSSNIERIVDFFNK